MEVLGIQFIYIFCDCIGAEGFANFVLFLGQRFAVAVSRGARCVCKPFHFGFLRRIKNVDETGDIDFCRCHRVFDGTRHRPQRGLVQHVIRPGDGLAAHRNIADIPFDQSERAVVGKRRQVFAFTGHEVVKHNNFIVQFQQGFDQIGTDEPGTAGYENARIANLVFHASESPVNNLARQDVLDIKNDRSRLLEFLNIERGEFTMGNGEHDSVIAVRVQHIKLLNRGHSVFMPDFGRICPRIINIHFAPEFLQAAHNVHGMGIADIRTVLLERDSQYQDICIGDFLFFLYHQFDHFGRHIFAHPVIDAASGKNHLRKISQALRFVRHKNANG